jgi:F-type H+-transporting ATPase subunit a
MADPVLHIKDGYFFEVPKFLWRHKYESLDEVPAFLRDAHPHATVEEFGHELSGKILIPQPFGTLKNLHDKQSGFCISKFMILEVVIAALLVYLLKKYARQVQNGEPARGKFWNAIDAIVLYVRDQVARPAIGEHHADHFVPLLWSVFFFILTCNLFGMIPWLGAPTGTFGTTLALSCVTLGTVLFSGMKQFGVLKFWWYQSPDFDLPWVVGIPLKIFVLAIEIGGLFIKHGVLAVRLLANMVAGHLVLLGVMGIIASAAAGPTWSWSVATILSVLGSVVFSLLELFVAFLQAYVFTFLSALFIGAAIHHH